MWPVGKLSAPHTGDSSARAAPASCQSVCQQAALTDTPEVTHTPVKSQYNITLAVESAAENRCFNSIQWHTAYSLN